MHCLYYNKNYIFNIVNNSLVKETFIYTATDLLGKAMSFILLPIVSFYMVPEELGIATNFSVLTQLVSLLAGMAVVNSLPYFFYEQDRNENASMVSNLLLLCISLCLLFVICAFIFHRSISQYLQLDLSIQLLGVLYVLGSLISQTNLVLLRLENLSHKFAFLQISQIIMHTLVVVIFVILLKGGGVGKIYAEVLVYTIMGLLHLFFLFKKGYVKWQYDWKWMKTLFKFGIPLLPHSISFWFKGGMDKVLITTYCGLQFNGLYSMALSISSIFTLLVSSFFSAYTPYLQKLLSYTKEENVITVKYKIVKQTYMLFFLFIIVALFTLALSWIIIHFMLDKKYQTSFDYLPLIILANYIYLVYNFTIQYIYKMKKTLTLGLITFSGSIIQTILSYLLIRQFGVMGAIYSFVIGNIIISFGVAFYSYIVYPMPWLKAVILKKSKQI